MGSASNKVQDISSTKYGKRHSHQADFDGPVPERSCTDVLCLVIFVLFLLAWFVIGIYSFTQGDPRRLIYPSNSNGDICGQGDFKDKPYLLFFDLSRCAIPSALVSGCPTPQVCVEECPTSFERPYADSTTNRRHLKRRMFPFCTPQMKRADINDTSVTPDSLIESKICPPWWVPSAPYLKRCIPFFSETDRNEEVANDTVIVDGARTLDGSEVTGGVILVGVKQIIKLLDVKTFGERVLNDLAASWWMVFIALILATAFALTWVLLMRYMAAIMVWVSILCTMLLLVLGCVYSIIRYRDLNNLSDSDDNWFEQGFTTDIKAYADLKSTWMLIFFVCLIILIIVILLLIFLRKRLAIELIEEASIAIGDMIATLFFPVFPFMMELIVVAWFIVVALHLGSSGKQQFRVNTATCPVKMDRDSYNCLDTVDGPFPPPNVTKACPDSSCEFYRYGNPEEINYLQLYNLFALLWSLFFISAMEEMVMAGAFATWYFTMDKKHIPRLPLIRSFQRTFRFHLGTLAFGSLIIAIIRFIRLMIEYVEEKLKESNQDSKVVQCLLCCCRCFFWCLESFMKFLNRNAYIMTAIYGKNFCWSAKESFSLLMRNALRVVVLDKITDFLLLMGKLVVVGLVGFLSFIVFSGRLVDFADLNFYLLPVILIILGTFFIADIFFGVFEMAVDTIFLCFLEDIERNDGSPEKPYFMSKDLLRILDYTNKEQQQKEAED